MREIKFKMWDGKKMHLNPMTDEKEEVSCLFNHGVWLQFTGLKDKNGKEVYEGDVVKIPRNGEVYHVEYSAPEFTLEDYETLDYYDGDSTCWMNWAEFEVIGNIHENPELLDNAK